ncbi:hypothetical protein BaRGS_00007350 [Batillaria attramentaria]|uniref:Uncharacterized protein n=1 Tax=Batillaria attramentaria TaxID=370345 RepID=A0ABD0LQM3_9CAEN
MTAYVMCPVNPCLPYRFTLHPSLPFSEGTYILVAKCSGTDYHEKGARKQRGDYIIQHNAAYISIESTVRTAHSVKNQTPEDKTPTPSPARYEPAPTKHDVTLSAAEHELTLSGVVGRARAVGADWLPRIASDWRMPANRSVR